jgi:hypothetical protein
MSTIGPILTQPIENLSDPYAAFQIAYIAAQNPAKSPFYYGLRGGQNLPQLNQTQIDALVKTLNEQNVVFDEEIDYEGCDSPLVVMKMRKLYGIPWVFRGTGGIVSVEVESPSMYAGPMPPDGIPTTTDIASYKPWPGTVPTPATTVPTAANVGPQDPNSGLYELIGINPTPGMLGAKVTANQVNYKLIGVKQSSMFGDGTMMYFWQVQP